LIGRLCLWLFLPLLGGCAGMYFHDAGAPPAPPPQHALADLPYDEYWTGLIFNGNKIGFTHLRIAPVLEQPDLYQLRARAVMRFHFLTIDKKVNLESTDVVHADLSIDRIHGKYELDGNRLEVSGTMTREGLDTTIESRGEVHRETIPVRGKLYPSSVIAVYPIVHGLEVGRHYAYDVYDGETQSISTVTQDVLGYEASELFEGHAFKIRTRLHGQEATTWMSEKGLPLLEMSMNGILIAGLESEETARRYLTRAVLNKQESLLDFSRVPAEPGIPQPRAVHSLVVELRGLDAFVLPSDDLQRCRQQAGEARCEIRIADRDSASAALADKSVSLERYLRSTVSVPSRHVHIYELAREIIGSQQDSRAQVALLVDWIRDNVEAVAVDSFSALDVLATRKAECQGNTYLYAAFARSLGIPTRVVNGLVYSDIYGGGFFYHTWAESWLDNRWVPVDPTFGQVVADATHIKLLEGESPDQLTPLVGLMGRLKATVVTIEHGG
jgi:hypothetical protein